MQNKQDKGFTLVELLIVIVILGILATVTVFAVRGITDQGQQSACAADEQTLQVALESYYAQNGTAADPTEQQLVDAGLLVSTSGNYEIVPGVNPNTGNIEPGWGVVQPDPLVANNPC